MAEALTAFALVFAAVAIFVGAPIAGAGLAALATPLIAIVAVYAIIKAYKGVEDGSSDGERGDD